MFDNENKTSFNWGGMLGGATGLAGTVLGMMTQGAQDDRQVEQQKKLNKLQVESQKEMRDFNNQKDIEMAEKMGPEWQRKQLEKAGLSVGLMYGKGGPGGATTGSPGGQGASGAQAANSAATTSAAATGPQMGLMMAQIANTLAETAKTNAELPKVAAETDLTKSKTTAQDFENAVNKMITVDEKVKRWDLEKQMQEIETTREGAAWEAYQANGFEGKAFNDPNTPIAKALRAGWEQTVTNLQNAKKDGNIKDAQTAIEQFKARLADQGLSPDTPWYAKLLSDLLSKAGINPLDWAKEKGKESIKKYVTGGK